MDTVRITDVQVIVTCPLGVNFVVVKILTDQPGLYGLGNASLTAGEAALATMIEQHLAPRLIGNDVDRVEDTWQVFQRATYWRVSRVLASAMAAIDLALWDIKGKRAGLPLYSLLGGKCRDKVLCYTHASGGTIEETVESAQRYREAGFEAIRCQVATPGYEGGSYGAGGAGRGAGPVDPDADAAHRTYTWEPVPYLRSVPRLFERLRLRLGEDVHLLHDAHDRLTPIQVAQLAKELEPYHLFFLEDPMPIENKEGLRLLRQHTTTPIAIGERYSTKWDTLPAITNQWIDYVRNSVAKSGGITELRKIAAIAEPFQVKTAFQGPADVGPLAFAGSVHLDYAVPNFGIQEWAGFRPEYEEFFQGIPTLRDGYLYLNEKPGLGVEIDEAKLRACPYQPRFVPLIRREDGSLQDP